jgi:hypothetical protein
MLASMTLQDGLRHRKGTIANQLGGGSKTKAITEMSRIAVVIHWKAFPTKFKQQK